MDPYVAVRKSFEYANFSVIILLLFLFLFFKENDLDEYFIHFGIVLCLLGCLSLIYVLVNDPFYVVGQRAGIRFDKSEESSSNPHIFGKTSYFGVILSILAVKYKSTVKWGTVFPFLSLILNIIVIFLTQTVSTIVVLFMFLAAYIFFNFKFYNTGNYFRSIFTKWYFVLFFIASFGGLSYVISENQKIVTAYTHLIEVRVNNLVGSFFEDETKTKKKKIDVSANERLEILEHWIEMVDEDFEEGKLRYLFFGHGYKNIYFDNPALEVFHCFGLFVFIFYMFIYFYLIKISLQTMANPSSMYAEFFAYAFLYYCFQNFVGGLVIEYTRLGFYFAVARLVNNKIMYSAIKTKLKLT